MLIYLTLLAWAFVTPVQCQVIKSSLVYYTPFATHYVPEGYYPLLQSPEIPTHHGKTIKNAQSHNEIIFMLNPDTTEQFISNTQPQNLQFTRYAAPSSGIADTKWAWLLKSNGPLLSSPKNEAILENSGLIKEQEKNENNKKSSEAEGVAESEISSTTNYLKKPITSILEPDQRFYVFNQQPQLFANYQPEIPRTQPTILQQLLTKSAIPSTQNILFLQPQEIQPPTLKFRNPNPPTLKSSSQSTVFIQKDLEEQNSTPNNQPHIKPIRYHSQNLKPQNYVYKGDTTNDQTVPHYSQFFFGRFLPGTNEIKSQALHQGLLQQQISHQTHYIPVEVVPPQVPLHIPHNPFESHNIPQHDFETQKLSFIHIPIDKNVVLPPYIKSVVPFQINGKEIPVIPPQSDQQKIIDKQVLYLSASAQPNAKEDAVEMNAAEAENQNQQKQIQIGEGMPGVSALEFIRYINSRQNNLDGDTVVINARVEEENMESDATDESNIEITEEPSISRAQSAGIALAGPGGVASIVPRGTAIVGPRGLTLANPQATGVAGPEALNPEKKPSTRS